jgi:hypothetical protein
MTGGLGSAAAIGLLMATLAACDGSGPARPETAPCPAQVRTDALPGWARAGFTGDGAGVPHVLGARGEIVAVLFAYPPHTSSDPNGPTKILWVSRPPQRAGDPLRIAGTTRDGRGSFRHDVANGPGPSGVPFPTPGCWHLDLRWGANSDSLDLKVE